MIVRMIVTAVAIGATLCNAMPAGAALPSVADLGWTVVDDGDEESPTDLVELAAQQADLSDELNIIGAGRCRSGSREKHARIEYTDAAGLPTFTFFHDVSFSWNCKNVTSVAREVRYEIYQPQYSFQGYLQNSVTPSNRPAVTSSAQGRFGICESAVGSVCALERQPSITWKIDATGRATVKVTP